MKKYLSIQDLLSMSEEELTNVHSIAKKNGSLRCATIGIFDLNSVCIIFDKTLK